MISSECDTSLELKRNSNSRTVSSVNENGMSDKFNYTILYDNFQAALIDDNDISLDHYLTGYEELCKFCNLLGTAFGFIGSEIESKIKILRDYQSGENRDHYKTVKHMIDYEQSSELIQKSDYVSGSRTLLRLHRGLDFFRLFLEKISRLSPDEPTNKVGQEVYEQTMGLYHSWLVRVGAGVAMYMLPSKCVLFETVAGNDNVEGALEFLPKVIDVTNQVYERVQNNLGEHQLLDLA